MNISDLNMGERHLVRRRRLRETQKESANRLGMSLYRYRKVEAGTDDKPPSVALGSLLLHEQCVIRRIRAGQSVECLSGLMALSAWWLTKMEYGRENSAALVRYWGC